ncbi:MAG TPA: PDR/VanB family oxidoreductase [Bradyrhizobium sp.]|nr:PDR/VanB family oxidoreductase [Bradyrhizobium sp.]
MTTPNVLQLRLWSVGYAAEGVMLFEFRSPEGLTLPPYTPGAHIDLYLPNGLVRQYSLVNDYATGNRYVIAVKRSPASTGGSCYMHDQLRVGTLLQIGTPRNLFPLIENAEKSVFVAGGIGISPIFSMIHRLAALGRSWELYYALRRREDAALFGDLPTSGTVHLHVSTERFGERLDVAAVVQNADPQAELYCCGPNAMIDDFVGATKACGRLPERVHVEYFSGAGPTEASGSFSVELARSGRVIAVAAGVSIVEALREAGIETMVSCEKGVCGACETRVLRGTPDHRDLILTEEERSEGQLMMICCSRAKSEMLVLDL